MTAGNRSAGVKEFTTYAMAPASRAFHQLGLREHRQQHHGSEALLRDVLGRRDAVHHWPLHVHHNHARLELPHERHGLLAVRGLAIHVVASLPKGLGVACRTYASTSGQSGLPDRAALSAAIRSRLGNQPTESAGFCAFAVEDPMADSRRRMANDPPADAAPVTGIRGSGDRIAHPHPMRCAGCHRPGTRLRA